MSVTDLPARSPAASAEQDASAPRHRWQPYRAGILNVWRYYDEIFTFHQGRLLLRGQNGTGKSKALELLLPFLFDASLRPNRLSTFGGSERTMHWNLMGEGATGKTRVGYVWMEFGCPTDDGGTRWFTCGARLQASIHTPGAHADYFTTSRRIARPDGILLVNEAGQPLTKAALTDALGDNGEIHPSADSYRTAVRRTLFAGMGEQRYEALITALLQLRQPKLSERLDPSLLSTLLSRALPPLGEGEISELAEGFERLDRQRDHLKDLDKEVEAASTIAAQQRGYAQRVLRAHAATLISATTDMDNLTRVARESDEQYEQAVREQRASTDQRKGCERRTRELEAAIEGLMDHDAYQQGKELDDLHRRTERAADIARGKRATADDKLRHAGEDRQRAEIATDSVRSAIAHAQNASQDARRAGRDAGLESVHREAEAMLDGPLTATDPSDMAGATGGAAQERVRPARQLLRGAVKARQGQIAEVVAAVGLHEQTVRERATAEAALDQARTRLAEAVTRRDEAADAYEEALVHQAELLTEWAAGCVELRFEDIEELASRTAVEADVMAAVQSSARTADRGITEARTRAEAARGTALTERAELAGAIDTLHREADLPPAAPQTRTADRSTMIGAPLWRLVAFHDAVPVAVQSGVEAALEASGLLDAWVSPYGGVALPGHDAQADAAWAVPAPGPSLLDVLRPEPDVAVPADTVSRLLAGIAFGPLLPTAHTAAVGADGSWRLASATGTWSKPEPAHIGSVARERARHRRIAELTERLSEVNGTIAVLDTQVRELRERRSRLEADLAARPRYRDLDAKRRAWDRAEEGVGVRDDAVRGAVGVLADRESEVAKSLRALSRLAAEHLLPTGRDHLRKLSSAVEIFRDTADAWMDAHLHWSTAAERAASESSRAARSLDTAREHAADAEAAEEEAQALAATLGAVESTVGQDFRAIAARIGEYRQELGRTREEIKAKGTEILRLAELIGGLQEKTAKDADERDKAVGARDEAARRFRHLSALGLAEDAGLAANHAAQEGTRATLEAARAVAAKWPDLPYAARNLGDAVNRLSEAIHRARESVGRRADLDLESDEDVQLFTASMDGVRIGAAGLLKTLMEERDSSRDDITVAERRLFDQTLTGDTRRHLAARIRGANELVDRMNGHLQHVRTASKVAVQLVWQIHPDLPPETRTARELLLKDPTRITESDREALHAFFRARIEEAKAKNTAASWEDQLAQVLDYTAWHQFVVKLDRANGSGWQLLTKKLHGALSGGEKAIALHLPLFAAVASHYEAVPEAPRPILLDEVFVGVDSTNRGQVFALLSALDLDLILTSDHEWCTYRELSGIAVHQLITGADDGDDAVTSVRFVWNGIGVEAEEVDGPGALEATEDLPGMSDFTGLDGRALRPLWQAVHERLSCGRPVSRVRIGPLDDEQRGALADLLGLDRLPDVRPSIALARLEEAVADAGGHTLRDVVAGIVGPLDDRAAVRQRRKDEREDLWAWLAAHETVRSQPALVEWVAQCRGGGLIDGSVPRTRDLLSSALAVLAALPAQGQPLPVFAARVVGGDSHALDDGTRLSSLVLRALSVMHGGEMPGNAQQRRAMWSRAGVADDDLSGTVLAAGLHLAGDGLLSRITGACTQAGHAASLTLAQLRDPGDLRLRAGPLHVTENPSVMALALRRFGTACPPLVCTSGWPNSAAVHLLRLLADHGAALRYHGDFDGEGIRIAAYVLDKTPAAPWRMTAADYRDALARTPYGPAVGRLTTAPWDPALTAAMAERGTAVLEETVADLLLDDLTALTGRHSGCRGTQL